MTLEVHLEDSEALALRQKAETLGKELSVYAGEVLRREARRPVRTLQQIAEDIEARRGGPINMGEDEISDMLEAAKHGRRAERRQPPGQ